jgi:hypothetical protein
MPHTPTSPSAVGGTHKLEDFIRRANEVAIDTQKSTRTDDENWDLLQRHLGKTQRERARKERMRALLGLDGRAEQRPEAQN